MFKGWHLRIRHAVSKRPLIGPCRKKACFEYSEQVGANRQAGDIYGDRAFCQTKMSAKNGADSNVFIMREPLAVALSWPFSVGNKAPPQSRRILGLWPRLIRSRQN